MLTLITFLEALILLGGLLCVTYCAMSLTAYCLLWLIGKLSFKPGDNRRQRADRTPYRMSPQTSSDSGKQRLHFLQRETRHASVE
jgi:hypothetical protein